MLSLPLYAPKPLLPRPLSGRLVTPRWPMTSLTQVVPDGMRALRCSISAAEEEAGEDEVKT